MKKVSIGDVAKYAGVSQTTVSRVLNNVKTVKEDIRSKVLEAIKTLNYRPNVSAQRLAGSTINTLSLVIPQFEDMFHSFYALEVLRGASFIIEKHNFDLLLYITEISKVDALSYERMLNITQTGGVLFADIDSNEQLLGRLKTEEVPFVIMNNFLQDPDINCVAIDNKNGAKNLIKYLIGLGHSKIAIITGDLKNQSARTRLDGYKDALDEAQISLVDQYVMLSNWKREGARRATEELLKLSSRPTAIFAASDEMAYEAILVLRENKVRVPEDISIVGFDDSPFSTFSEIAITTMRQPVYDMAREACDAIIGLIKDPNQPPIKKLLKTSLIERASCARRR
ncbi:MAG: LacI family DNA-binding transcriptional regulator [Candidatus Omnitrophota bacterium]